MADLSKTLSVSASGMDAQTARLRVIAENLANQDSTGSTPGAEAYRRKTISFESKVAAAEGVETVQVKRIGQDQTVQPGRERRGLRQDDQRQQLHRGHGHAGSRTVL